MQRLTIIAHYIGSVIDGVDSYRSLVLWAVERLSLHVNYWYYCNLEANHNIVKKRPWDDHDDVFLSECASDKLFQILRVKHIITIKLLGLLEILHIACYNQ